MSEPMIRAIYRAINMPGEESSLYCKLYYPAIYSGSMLEKNTGSLPPAPTDQPYPIAILMPGINVSPEAYGWLATALAEAGFVSLIYGWILEEMPGMVALSPGLDISALKPDDYAQRPSATALDALFNELKQLNSEGPLSGLLDLDRVLLGGHSAGGSVALFNANPEWFPGLKACFSYGSHSKASTMLGYDEDTVLDLPDSLPTLIMGGSQDGVIAASAFRYGDDDSAEPDPTGPLLRTFSEGLKQQREDSYLAIVNGANHFSLAYPADPATGRPFLDWETSRDDSEIRQDITQLICQFAKAHVANDAKAQQDMLRLLGDTDAFSIAEVR